METPGPANLIREVIFLTDNVPELRRYLKAQRIIPSKRQKPDTSLTVLDPDGHSIVFDEQHGAGHLGPDRLPNRLPPIPLRLIHAGFIVRDRTAMEHFYQDILGFRPYWQGGMKDDRTDWISQQVPDGTDWVEFMVNVPENADQHLRGVMNHIALGVTDIHEAREQLVKNGVHLTEEPKLGRDGKWQLNLYDPDQTRIEFMEFAPKEKPCCSDFTGPHPKP